MEMIGYISSAIAGGLFGLIVVSEVYEIKDWRRKQRRARKIIENQNKAYDNAVNLLVFDATLTREHLVREWERL